MQYHITTFGNGEILKGVLDAIKMCMNSQDGTLYEPLMRIGLIFGVFWAAVYSIWGDYLRAWGKATIPFVLIPPLLFVPTATVYIKDVISGYRDKVDNVPYGLACVTHFISEIGFEVTRQVDQVFASVDDLKYHKSGFLMASNLIQQAKAFRITNEDVAENMRQFVCQCVAYEAMLGYKYTLEDLRHTNDIWGLVSAKASPIRSFVWRQPHKAGEPRNSPEIISCRDGVKRFNLLWKGEIDRTQDLLGKKLFGHTNPLTSKRELLKYLPLSFNFLTNLAQNADEILKQQMMIYAVVDGIEQKSTALGNAPNFAARRAYLQQRSTYETLGAMASESLMTMKAVLEAIAYASFIFLVPLAILPFGVKVLLSWVQTLLWLQMWAPLYAVLNFIMSTAARSKSIGMLSTSNPEGITIASSVGLMNLNADMSAMAGYLAMSIPFLAIALVKGVGSFVHMASHLGNVSQGAASQAAGDAVSGNYSFGNVSQGNMQYANTTMLSQSRAASYKAGSFQFMDGRDEITTMADGSQVANIGISNLPISINKSETDTAQLSENATQAYQKALGHSESSAKSLANSYRSLVSLSENLAKSQSFNDGMSQGVSTEQSRAIHKGAQLIEDFSEANGINTEKSAQIFSELSAGGGIFIKGSVGGKGHLSASDQELLNKAEKFATDENFQKAVRESAQAAQNISHNVSDEKSRRLAKDVAGSYEEGINERYEASKSFSQSAAYTQQAMNMRVNSAAINANYNQQFMEWLSDQRQDNTGGRIGIRGAINILSGDPQQAEGWARQFQKQHSLTPVTPMPFTPKQVKQDYEAETGHKRHTATQGDLQAVEQAGAAAFAPNLGDKGSQFRANTSSTMGASHTTINQGSSAISQEGEHLRAKVQNEQGRSVAGRVVEKLGAEGLETVKDIKNAGSKFADNLHKIQGGSSHTQQEGSSGSSSPIRGVGIQSQLAKSPPKHPPGKRPAEPADRINNLKNAHGKDAETLKKLKGEPQQK